MHFWSELSWGGVEVEAARISQSTFEARFELMSNYACVTQPTQVKRDISRTVASFRKKGKKYITQNPDIIRTYLEKRFNLYNTNGGRISGPAWQSFVACFESTELFLQYKINKTKYPTFESYDRIAKETYKSLYGGR